MSICRALPAAAAWLIVALLRGQLYTCAAWNENISCPNGINGTMIEYNLPACKVPSTEQETEFPDNEIGCIKIHARNLRAIR